MILADLFLDQLYAWGVRRIYGLVGDTLLPFMDRLDRHPIEFIPVRHEESAAFMASAEAKLTGGLGVCLATSGPGVLHLMNGIADAYEDRVPVLSIGGQVKTRDIGTNYKQYIDQQTLMAPITCFTALVADESAGPDLLAAAMRQALTSKQPAHLAVPDNLWTRSVWTSPREPEPFLNTRAKSPPHVWEEARRRVQAAQKPIFLIGAGAVGAGQEILRLAEMKGAGIIYTSAAKGSVMDGHSLVLGGLGEGGSEPAKELLEESDLLVVFGANWWPRGFVPKNPQTLVVDSEPGNIAAGPPVGYGVVADSREFAEFLMHNIVMTGMDNQWAASVRRVTRQWWEVVDHEASDNQRPAHPAAVMKALSEAIGADAIVVLDVGAHFLWFNRAFRAKNQRMLISGKWRSMGFSLPAAIAAKIISPGSEVWAVTGDGGFGMSLHNLMTARRLGLGVRVAVINNGSLALERSEMELKGLSTLGTGLEVPDFAQVANSFGCSGVRLEDPEALLENLGQSAADRPVVFDIITRVVPVPGLVHKVTATR